MLRLTLLVVLTLCAGTAALAQEVFFLACSGQTIDEPLDGDDDSIVTKLYEVTFDDDTKEANLEEIAVSPLNQADAIACSQEGKCYVIDRFLENHPDLEGGGFIEEYTVDLPGPPNVSGGKLIEFTDGGFPNPLQGLVLAAFHPDGRLFGASQDQDLLWTIDLDLPDMNNPTADPVGATGAVMLDGSPLDIEGADLVFTADHQMFLWTNGLNPGLYELTLPLDDLTDTIAVRLDASVDVPGPNTATGLAARENGTGNIVLSQTDDVITEHSLTDDGLLIETFAMVNSDPAFDHKSGDMANVFDCLMQCQVNPRSVMPGEEMSVSIDLFHNRALTVQQQFDMKILNDAGQVLFARSSPKQTFTRGDHVDFDVRIPIPDNAKPGSYTIEMGVAGMQQGEAVAQCSFQVGGP